MSAVNVKTLINLERYPIEYSGQSSYEALIQRCRAQFDDAVSCHLPGFLRTEAVARILPEIDGRQNSAHLYSCYRGAFDREEPRSAAHHVELAKDDPCAKPLRRHQLWLGTDDLCSENGLRTLYDWPPLTRFVIDVLGCSALYTLADPLMRILINIHRDGDELGWHVDSHDYAVSILLRPALSGGLFQYVPMAGPGDENFEYCGKLFAGDLSQVRTVPMDVGSMVIFRGRNTVHRVSPAGGRQTRALALFSYDSVPERTYGSQFRLNLLGRDVPRTIGASYP
jgi:hypothetical protein